MKKRLLFFLLLALCSSCSTVEFNTSGNEVFYVSTFSKSEKEITVEVEKDFYFWGLSPEKLDFDLQDEFESKGVYNPSFVKVTQKTTFSNLFYTIITLGLYAPVTYEVRILSNGNLK